VIRGTFVVVALADVTSGQLRDSLVVEAIDRARPHYRRRVEVEQKRDLGSMALRPNALLEVEIDSTQEEQFLSLVRKTEIAKNGVPVGPSRN
jgi:hypothetical protein